MGAALELISGGATAPSSTFTAWTVATGNSLTIRSAEVTSQVSLLAAWGQTSAAGEIRIRSPRLHDNVDGIRFVVESSDTRPRYPRWAFMQPLIPQDTLIVEITGSGTSGHIENGSFLVYYANLPGIAARFITSAQLRQFGRNMMGVKSAITAGSSGGYSGQQAITATRDNFKANTNYALVGYLVDASCCSVRWQGADVGNLGVGGPGCVSSPHTSSQWFLHLSDYYGLPLIPVFQSANKGNILIDVLQDNGGAAVNVTSFFVELQGLTGL